MSALESRINSIASIAIDATVNKADTANPVFYGSLTLNKIPEQPNNNLTCNVPSTFNSSVSIINDLNVYGETYFATSSIGSYLKISDFGHTINNNLYTKTGTNQLITDLIDTAPDALNTLRELATASINFVIYLLFI